MVNVLALRAKTFTSIEKSYTFLYEPYQDAHFDNSYCVGFLKALGGVAFLNLSLHPVIPIVNGWC